MFPCRSITHSPDLEAEISHLKSRDKLSDEAKERLAKAESELKYVSRLKDKYVAAHPEAKDKIFTAHGDKRRRHPGQGHDDDDDEHEPRPDPMTHLYNADGTLRDPKKSAYYDPTYNPFGVPPPGMPYRERSEWGWESGQVTRELCIHHLYSHFPVNTSVERH
jgi:inosine triphosphate pyrophosphatase